MEITEAERQRWNAARAFAQRQRCDVATALDYADWIVAGVRGGYIVLPAPHAPLFAQWCRFATEQASR